MVVLNIVMLSGATALLTARNTTAGSGQDVSSAGHSVTNSAEKVKSGM
jgi:predicted small secreted protein